MQRIRYYCPILNRIATYGQVLLDRLTTKLHDNFNPLWICVLQLNIAEERRFHAI